MDELLIRISLISLFSNYCQVWHYHNSPFSCLRQTSPINHNAASLPLPSSAPKLLTHMLRVHHQVFESVFSSLHHKRPLASDWDSVSSSVFSCGQSKHDNAHSALSHLTGTSTCHLCGSQVDSNVRFTSSIEKWITPSLAWLQRLFSWTREI